MMQTLHALFVDDEQVLRDQYIENMAIAFRDSCGIELSHQTADRIEDAKTELRTGQQKFKLVVVDMLWTPLGGREGEREARGFEVIDQAIHTPGVVIVAVSVGNLMTFPFLDRDALARGAHLFRYRSALQSASQIGGWEVLATDIARKLHEVGSTKDNDEQRPTSAARDERSAFVVCGRDEQRNKSVVEFLRAIGIRALEWQHLEDRAIREGAGGNPHVFEIVRIGFAHAYGAVVIFTPDDEAELRPELRALSHGGKDAATRGQPRPNVLLEAGYALCQARERTLIVTIGDVALPSDVGGMHMLPLDNSVATRKTFAQRLGAMGFPVNTVGNQWLSAGDFS